MKRLMPVAVVAALLAGALAAAPAPTAPTVEIKNFAFSPQTLSVRAGDTVRFVNHDQEAHTVVAVNGAFSSNGLDTNGSWSVVLKKAGTYPYFCSLHPYMKGTITVLPGAR